MDLTPLVAPTRTRTDRPSLTRAKRVIVTSSSSAAGLLKAADIADRVLDFDYPPFDGPALFQDHPIEFFVRRAEAWSSEIDDWQGEYLHSLPELVSELNPLLRDGWLMEFWTDPTPNGVLTLTHLISILARDKADFRQTKIAEMTTCPGELSPNQLAQIQPRLIPLEVDMADLASEAWRAYCSPTPEAFFRLRSSDLSAVPNLLNTVSRLLSELPDHINGLTRTQSRLLTIIGDGSDTFNALFCHDWSFEPERILDYFRYGQTLCDLGSYPNPLIDGITERRFSLDLHDDTERWTKFRKQRLSLTALGRDALANRADVSVFNPIDRWWGGTHLNNDNLWRWDDTSARLIAPPSSAPYWPSTAANRR